MSHFGEANGTAAQRAVTGHLSLVRRVMQGDYSIRSPHVGLGG